MGAVQFRQHQGTFEGIYRRISLLSRLRTAPLALCRRRNYLPFMTPGSAILAIWILWALSWLAASAWTGRTAGRAGLKAELTYRAPIFAGVALIAFSRHGVLARHLYDLPPGGAAWAFPVLVAGGFLFAWWARLHLGPLWSSSVTRKQDHRIVDTGPYGFVRHPIYTGLIFSFLVSGAYFCTLAQLLGVPLAIAGIVVKARIEERFLREQLGREAYDAYARRVPMLVPLLKGRMGGGE